MKRLLTVLILVASLNAARASDGAVSLDDIVMLTQRGVSDQTILVFLQTRQVGFVPDAQDIDKLLAAGVGEVVIRYLLQQTTVTPVYTYRSGSYVDPYPDYYYRPYYTRPYLYLGIAIFPHSYYGHYYGGGHHYRSHYTTALHRTHAGHGAAHISGGHGYSKSHSGQQSPGHGVAISGTHLASAGHVPSASVGHYSRNASHNGRSFSGGHTGVSGGTHGGGGHSGGRHSGGRHSGGRHSGGGRSGGHGGSGHGGSH